MYTKKAPNKANSKVRAYVILMVGKLKQAVRTGIARSLSKVLPPNIMQDVRFFELWQSRGYHVTPSSFSSPIPDTREIPEDHFKKVSDLIGVDLREPKQIELFERFCKEYEREATRLDDGKPLSMDWFMLHCMIRSLKPRRVIEIGAGESTRITAAALVRNAEEGGAMADFTAIDPYPKETLKQGFPGLSRLLISPVQEVPIAEFEALRENDVLFIDSSHVLKIRSDVQYEFLELLPRLRKGVVVHVHDIFFPHDYNYQFIMERKAFWNEQYILQAFLTFNSKYDVEWCGSWMHHRHSDTLTRSFLDYTPGRSQPGSLWMRRVE